MPLNNLIKDYSLTTITEKTNIPAEILQKLINKDWESLQLTKAKGFIAIIEREFDVDLSELKNEATEYYGSHKKVEQSYRPIDLVDAQSVGGGAGKIVTNIVALLTIGLVAYAGWFYFVKPKSSAISLSDSNSSGLISESIDIAKSLVGIKKEPSSSKDSNSSSKNKESKVSVKNLKEEPKVIVTTQAEPKSSANNQQAEVKEQNATDSIVSNDELKEKKKFDITTDVKKSEQNSLKSEDTNSVTVVNLSANSSENSINEQTIKESNSVIKDEVNSLLEENKTKKEEPALEQNTSVQISENLDSNSSATLSEDTNTSEQVGVYGSVKIKPSVKAIWVGLYNLQSGKRVAKLVSGEFDFATEGSDIAIITGHSKFEVSTDSGLDKKFDGRGRKYLYISKKEIKELTKLEYKALTKEKAW